MTTAAQARSDRRIAQQIARLHAEEERREKHHARTVQLRDAVATMSARWVAAVRCAAWADNSRTAGYVFDGKTAEKWRELAKIRHYAFLRLLYALEDHANKAVQAQ